MTTTAVIALDDLTTTIDKLIANGGGDTVVGDLRIDVRARRNCDGGTDTLVEIVHTTATEVIPMRTTVRLIPWIVERHSAYDPADTDDIAEWHADILAVLAAGPNA
jgi:hypothetical protein